MSTFRNPVGPQPSGVYWRRRLLVGLGLVAVIVIVVLIIVKPGSGTPTPTGSSTPKASSSAVATPENADGTCAKEAIEVIAITDKGSYKAGEKPLVSLSIENKGATDCTFSVGPDVQVYTITTGDETVWTSTDCAAESEPNEVTLEAGKTLSTTPIAWDRTRSSAETCEGDRPQVTAGGASYHLSASVDGVESKDTKQFLLY